MVTARAGLGKDAGRFAGWVRSEAGQKQLWVEAAGQARDFRASHPSQLAALRFSCYPVYLRKKNNNHVFNQHNLKSN